MMASERVSRVSIAGSSSSARERWAAWRVVEGVSSKCCGGEVSFGLFCGRDLWFQSKR